MPRRVPAYRPPHLPAPADRHRDYNRSGRDPALLGLYSTPRWRRFRALIRRERVLCERCRSAGLTVVGALVHHKVDPRVDPERALDPENVELLCSHCHARAHAGQPRRRR
jgi:5-methylcytosine-specific restriction endonuclease McrA